MSIFDKIINIGTDFVNDVVDSVVENLSNNLIDKTPEQDQQQQQQQQNNNSYLNSGYNIATGVQSDTDTVPALQKPDLKILGFDQARNDFLNKERDTGLTEAKLPGINIVFPGGFSDTQNDLVMKQIDEALRPNTESMLHLPNLNPTIDFTGAQRDFFENQNQSITPSGLISNTNNINDVVNDVNDYLRTQSNNINNVPDLSKISEFKLPDIDFKNIENIKDEYLKQESIQKPPKIDVYIPSFENLSDAQRDFFEKQATQFPVINDDSKTRLNNYKDAYYDYSKNLAEQQPVIPNFDFGDIDSASKDYSKNLEEQQPAVFNFNFGDIDSASKDYFEKQIDRANEINNLSELPEIKFEDSRNDFLSRENAKEPATLEIKPPEVSYESFKSAQNDFNNQPQVIQGMQDIPLTNDEFLQKYHDYFDSKGGLEEGYITGDKDVLSGLAKSLLLNSSIYDRGEISSINPADEISKGLDKIANENIDDGTMRADSVKAKYMTRDAYIEYVKNGFGGRSLEELENMDPGQIFNKVDEAKNYGFVPYIEDLGQYSSWSASQLADDTTKAYNIIGQARDLLTDAQIEHNGQQISREAFYDNVGEYFNSINDLFNSEDLKIMTPDNPEVDPSKDLPLTIVWTVPGTDVEIPTNQQPRYIYSDTDDSIIVYWPGFEDQAVKFDNDEDYYTNIPVWNYVRSGDNDQVHAYAQLPMLSYTQNDGSKINLSYSDAEDIAQSMANGTANVDWGPFNIAKDTNDRKDWDEMITSGDFSDIVPNMVDLTLGSAPLFTPTTAWPMAIANAGTATQGLDPRLYNAKDNTMYRLSDDMTGEKYLSNIVLSGLIPATEKVAGVIGGGGGVIGKPIQKFLERIGAPAFARYGVDVLGEGIEEDVASLWEDYQTNGLSKWFANPIYKTDNEGNVLMQLNTATNTMEPVIDYDDSGHEKRDENTPLNERFDNFIDQLLGNTFAGVALGGTIGAPRIIADSEGYRALSQEQKALRDLEKMYNIPRYKEAKPGNNLVTISPNDIGTYGKRQ